MILLLDTSTPVCKISLFESATIIHDEWESGRGLAKGLLGYIQSTLTAQGKNWQDISGIVVYKGPGSFTGLRIGLTVLNTIADSEKVPIVGTTTENWQSLGLTRLEAGQNDTLVMPEYGTDAHITIPRK